MRTRITVTQAARYLGVSTATLSRHLPPERARRGSPAALSVDEVTSIGAELGLDPRLVREQLQAALGIDPALPEHMRAWAERAILGNRVVDLDAYNARIPADLLERPAQDVSEDFVPREPWDASVQLLDEERMVRWMNGEG